MRLCMSLGVSSYKLPSESFKAYLFIQTRAAKSSPLKYFTEASKRAKTTQAQKNYKERADQALQLLRTDLPEPESEDFEYDTSVNVAKILTLKTSEQCCVCKRPAGSGEVVQCTQCKSIAHFPHMAEWLKIKGVCPVCKQKLVLPESKKVALRG